MKAQRYFVLLAAVGFAGVMVTACSKSETNPAAGAGGNTPTGASIVAASSAATTVPVTAASTGGGAVSNLGLNCAVDADCSGDGNSLTCATSTTDDVVLGGGPPAGYCTKSCKTDTDCPTNGSCLGGTATGPKECLLNCTIGPALTATSVPDPNKCQGRPELRCRELSAATSICLPDCGSDANCDTGRVCDPASGACVDPANVSKGDPTGASCDPSPTAAPTCAGICISFQGEDANVGACSSPCTLVGNVQTDCGGLANGFCGFAPAAFGIGDSAFCTTSCEKQDDCQNPLFFCFDIGAQNGKGYCFGATDCPNGNSDCVDPTTMKPLTETCHETKYGPKCIDPTKFPLGTAGSGGGGGAGATGGAGGAGGSGGGLPTTSLGGAGGTAPTGGAGGKAPAGAGGGGGK